MVKNIIGGSKSKNIGSKFTKKKIIVEEPDFENSFFATVSQKPNGLMCKVKIIINNDKVKYIIDKKCLEGDIQVNIGKLKHDKRNNTIAPGDIVQVEFTFDMNRQNGAKYGAILCRYDNYELKEFNRTGILKSNYIQDSEEEMPYLFDYEDDKNGKNSKEDINLNNKNDKDSEDIDLDNNDIDSEDIDLDDL